MHMNDKIMKLRKDKGWSQEDLAYKLDVSRQAVSKWESGVSQPEIEKIVNMAQLFNVTTDYLLMDTANHHDIEVDQKKLLSDQEIDLFMKDSKKLSKYYSLAIALFVSSPVLLIFLMGLKENQMVSETIALIFGLSMIFISVAIGLVFFIFFGIKEEKYTFSEKTSIYIKEETRRNLTNLSKAYENKFSLGIVIGIILFIIAPLPLIICAILGLSDYILISLASLILLLVAVGLWIIVKVALIKDMYDKLLEQGEFEPKKKKTKKKMELFDSIYWPIITAVYLVVSFITFSWDLTWLIWVIAGIVYAVLNQIINYRKEA